MTSATVMGASLPVLNEETCCGTLSSRIRKLPRGILGMKRPLLSRTATSTCTVVASLLKVGSPSGKSLSFLLNFDGILGSSGASGVEAAGSFLRGLATVSEDCDFGPSCPTRSVPVTRNATINSGKLLRCFIGSHLGLYQKQRRMGVWRGFVGRASRPAASLRAG